ncbi:Transmembrane emp24 domain-containing protein [Melia azedarach]|uniref:Transmembrane emp24 domain-containing protein n=1 Tax=Melia azedarach TaxID=155640 RepID=A0ACC1YVC9_MELAZ|nr:Transmembrane emp24 domain-containing protein [Melia azedarach]
MRRRSAEICLILGFMLSFIRHVSTLSITVTDVECVYENVLYEGDTFTGNFVVIDHEIFWNSDHPGIDLTVTCPSVLTPEVVSFYIHVGHIPNEHDLAKDEHLDPIYVKIAELREALESVTAEQKYLKAQDSQHRHTNESTRKRVVFYTLSEYFLLAGTSALQVVYIRRLFSFSAPYGRV